MNSPNLGRLLCCSGGIELPKSYREPLKSGTLKRPSYLLCPKMVSLKPVWPALLPAETFPAGGGKRRPGAGFVGGIAIAFTGVLLALVTGMERVHYVRENYQLSVQLRQRERELHQAQRAYQALAAYVAVQSAREPEAELRQASLATPVARTKVRG
jgi:hypothetical protein